MAISHEVGIDQFFIQTDNNPLKIKMTNKLTFTHSLAKFAILATGNWQLAICNSFSATTWIETGDAPDGIVGLIAGQHTSGSGPLTTISGTHGNGDGTWDSSDDHVDACRITVTDPSAFFASTVASDGGIQRQQRNN